MIEISQDEFEQKIQEVIDGKYTRADLIKQLKVDRITLNNKIQELYITNPELYLQFIRKFPYKPREYTHIDYEAMIIDIMKKGYKKKEAAEQYGIHDRTIARKIHQVEKTNPDLVALYRKVAFYRKCQYELPEDLQREIDALEEREVFVGGIYDEKEKSLLEKEKQYNETKALGISDAKAYGKRRTIKDLSTLYRLEIEQNVRERNQSSSQKKKEDVEIEEEGR